MFAWRPNDLIWNYWVSNYLLGNRRRPSTRAGLECRHHPAARPVPLRPARDGRENPFINAGTLEVLGVPVDMSKVKLGAYVIAGITDHITPWRACYGTARLFGPEDDVRAGQRGPPANA